MSDGYPKLDSLPYVDPVNEDYESYALSLVEEEMQKGKSRRPRPIDPIRMRSEILETEYQQRTQRQGPLQPLPEFESDGSLSEVQQLQEAVKRARVAYETERLRGVLLGVEKDESSDIWKQYIEQSLNQQHAVLSNRLEEQRSLVDNVNVTRKSEQEAMGNELGRGMRQYQELISKRIQLQKAIQVLEEEIRSLSPPVDEKQCV
jgi:hypothetical protein